MQKNVFRIVAYFLSVMFCLTSTVNAQENNVYSFTCPAENGTVQSRFKAEGEWTIIHIQDAHESLSAQENIAAIISDLNASKESETLLVAVEGAVGDVRADLFSHFPFRKVREKIAHRYLRKGVFSGAEYAAVVNDDVVLYGAEDKDSFLRNYHLFYQNIKKESIRSDIEKCREYLDASQAKEYSDELLELNRVYRRVFIEQKDFADFFNVLVRYSEKYDFDLMNYPDLYSCIESAVGDNDLSFHSAGFLSDLRKCMFELQKRVSVTERQNELIVFEEYVKLVERASRLELLPEDTASLRELFTDNDSQKRILSVVSNIKNGADLYTKFDLVLKRADDFYQVADERTEALVKNTLARMDSDHIRSAVLISGGYHSADLEKVCRLQGVNYVTVCPTIAKEDICLPFKARMAGDLFPISPVLCSTITGQSLYLMRNPISFWKKYTRESIAEVIKMIIDIDLSDEKDKGARLGIIRGKLIAFCDDESMLNVADNKSVEAAIKKIQNSIKEFSQNEIVVDSEFLKEVSAAEGKRSQVFFDLVRSHLDSFYRAVNEKTQGERNFLEQLKGGAVVEVDDYEAGFDETVQAGDLTRLLAVADEVNYKRFEEEYPSGTNFYDSVYSPNIFANEFRTVIYGGKWAICLRRAISSIIEDSPFAPEDETVTHITLPLFVINNTFNHRPIGNGEFAPRRYTDMFSWPEELARESFEGTIMGGNELGHFGGTDIEYSENDSVVIRKDGKVLRVMNPEAKRVFVLDFFTDKEIMYEKAFQYKDSVKPMQSMLLKKAGAAKIKGRSIKEFKVSEFEDDFNPIICVVRDKHFSFMFDNELSKHYQMFGFNSREDFHVELQVYLQSRIEAMPGNKQRLLKKTITIGLMTSSQYLFEDHLANGFIGVNKQLFDETISPSERWGLLQLGLNHELQHEAGMKDERPVGSADVEFVVEHGLISLDSLERISGRLFKSDLFFNEVKNHVGNMHRVSWDEALSILSLKVDFTADELKKNYRKKAIQMHPDRNPDDPYATAKLSRLNAANDVLNAPQSTFSGFSSGDSYGSSSGGGFDWGFDFDEDAFNDFYSGGNGAGFDWQGEHGADRDEFGTSKFEFFDEAINAYKETEDWFDRRELIKELKPFFQDDDFPVKIIDLMLWEEMSNVQIDFVPLVERAVLVLKNGDQWADIISDRLKKERVYRNGIYLVNCARNIGIEGLRALEENRDHVVDEIREFVVEVLVSWKKERGEDEELAEQEFESESEDSGESEEDQRSDLVDERPFLDGARILGRGYDDNQIREFLNTMTDYGQIDLSAYGSKEVVDVAGFILNGKVMLGEQKSKNGKLVLNRYAKINQYGNLVLYINLFRASSFYDNELLCYLVLREILFYCAESKDAAINYLQDRFGRSLLDDKNIKTRKDEVLYLINTFESEMRGKEFLSSRVTDAWSQEIFTAMDRFVSVVGGVSEIVSSDMTFDELAIKVSEVFGYECREMDSKYVNAFFSKFGVKAIVGHDNHIVSINENDKKRYYKIGEKNLWDYYGFSHNERIVYHKESFDAYSEEEKKIMLLHKVMENLSFDAGMVDPVIAAMWGQASVSVAKLTFLFADYFNQKNSMIDRFKSDFKLSWSDMYYPYFGEELMAELDYMSGQADGMLATGLTMEMDMCRRQRMEFLGLNGDVPSSDYKGAWRNVAEAFRQRHLSLAAELRRTGEALDKITEADALVFRFGAEDGLASDTLVAHLLMKDRDAVFQDKKGFNSVILPAVARKGYSRILFPVHTEEYENFVRSLNVGIREVSVIEFQENRMLQANRGHLISYLDLPFVQEKGLTLLKSSKLFEIEVPQVASSDFTNENLDVQRSIVEELYKGSEDYENLLFQVKAHFYDLEHVMQRPLTVVVTRDVAESNMFEEVRGQLDLLNIGWEIFEAGREYNYDEHIILASDSKGADGAGQIRNLFSNVMVLSLDINNESSFVEFMPKFILAIIWRMDDRLVDESVLFKQKDGGFLSGLVNIDGTMAEDLLSGVHKEYLKTEFRTAA